ncbi:MAG: tRNA (cytidine(34)-2'-O)-methyltransferase [Planctomycetota bacterium]
MRHVVLVHPEIPWNTGNAGRSCLAFDARLHLVEPLGFSLEEKKVRRAGVDYWAHVDPIVHRDWESFALRLPELGTPVLLTAEAERTFEPGMGNVFIFGCESVGLPKEIRDAYRGHTARIPMRDDRVRSLNLSTAVGIVLYAAAGSDV